MTYALLLISILTVLFWLSYRAEIHSICAVCAATVITWAVGIFSIITHASWADPLMTAILMGASLGAIADKYGSRFGLFWKTAVVILGSAGIYYIADETYIRGVVAFTALGIITIIAGILKGPTTSTITAKKDLFKECC